MALLGLVDLGFTAAGLLGVEVKEIVLKACQSVEAIRWPSCGFDPQPCGKYGTNPKCWALEWLVNFNLPRTYPNLCLLGVGGLRA